ncbi:uncharacterized protein [Rutidosis leptorrhynchoides]|uniref:uncharacterized protein n=1 Tax=Rutidosis leptorrhynchoides TaxID=125765 RepID=UPI003A99CE09
MKQKRQKKEIKNKEAFNAHELPHVKEKKPRKEKKVDCKWVVHISKFEGAQTWKVKTYHNKHNCLPARVNKNCTFTFLSKQILDQVTVNPKIPTKAIHHHLELTFELNISRMKAFRALDRVKKVIERELLGVDGAFMKQPATGQMLTAVGLECNNGLYPLAYAIVEQENSSSWILWLCDARDKPIITALEYITEYLMKRIAKVVTHASKSDGPLTPTATKLFDLIMKEAHKCTVLWSSGNKYQVNGPHNNQVVVDLEERSCGCRKWEITNTWKQAYGFTINPVNGRSLWTNSNVPNTLFPPKVVKSAGRPKNSKNIAMDEKDPIDNSGKLIRKGKTVKCGKCGKYGHNKRRCGGEGNDGVNFEKKRKMPNEAITSGKKSKDILPKQ